MAVELKPFDAADYLKNAKEMAAFLEDCYESGSPEVFADALEDVARACGALSAQDEDAAARPAPTLADVLRILREAKVSLRFVPAAAA